MKSKRIVFPAVILMVLTLGAGCKHFEYRVVQPTVSAQTISKAGVSVPYDPLTYQLARQDSRVIMQINNPTDTSVRLLGDRSYVVDPMGETHPIRSRLIAPHAFVELSFPPTPRYYGGSYYSGGAYYWSPYWYPFWYTDFYSGGSYPAWTQYDWIWRRGEARVHLSYEQDKRAFDHDFVLSREEMKK